MPPNSSTSSSSGGGRSLGLVLAAIASVEVGVALAVPVVAPIDAGARYYLPGVLPSLDASMVQWQGERLRVGDEPPADVLIIGDSAALMGLIPSVITERTGLRTQNLATVAHLGIDGQADVLEEHLARHPAPKTVVFAFGDWSFSATRAELARIGMLRGYREWIGRDERLVASWPSHRLRAAARRVISGAWYEAGRNDDGVRAFLFEHHGYLREPAELADWSKATRPDIAIHPDAADGLARISKAAAGAGAGLLLVHAPIPDVYESPQTRALYQANEALLRRALAQLGSGELLGPFARFAPRRLFGSPDHLNLEGAHIFSAEVADALHPRKP